MRRGDGTHPQKQTPQVNNKGMIPIEKNISVIDELGNEYEATYPKRAKGLVKKGRARFVDDNTICLACPPDIMEDTKMSDNKNVNVNVNANEETLNVGYILKQMAAIQQDNAHIYEALNVLTSIQQIDPEAYAPEDVAGRAKAIAIADVVKCRETTNQKLLAFYEKVYDDIGDKKVDEVLRIIEKADAAHIGSQYKINITDRAYETIMGYLESMKTSFAQSALIVSDGPKESADESNVSVGKSMDNSNTESDDDPLGDMIDKMVQDSIAASIAQSFDGSSEDLDDPLGDMIDKMVQDSIAASTAQSFDEN